jgi:drug/metabolite transporter (DMT)-like permease
MNNKKYIGEKSNNLEYTGSFSLIVSKSDFDLNRSTENPKHTETYGLLIFAISNILYGINAFQLKHMKVVFPSEYDGMLLGFWRGIAILIISLGIMKKKNINILDVREINDNTKFWLGVRSIGQFLAYVTYISALLYLRVATANCISSMNPVVVVILCTFILNEKFYSRYAVGIFICFIGTLMIILNDRKVKISDEEILEHIDKDTGIFYGTIYAVINLILIAMLSVSSKILIKEKIGFENQCFYLGFTNSILSILFFILFGKVYFFQTSIIFTFLSLINGCIFFIATQCLIESLRWVDLNKTTPLAYLATITVMILGVIFLGEPIFFTDVLGSMLILGYNVYNSFNPIVESPTSD